MNIELVKQFAVLSLSLKAEGVYGIFEDRLHFSPDVLRKMDNLQITHRDSVGYPYEIFTVIDGIRVFCLANDEILEIFPEFHDFKLETEIKEEEEATI